MIHNTNLRLLNHFFFLSIVLLLASVKRHRHPINNIWNCKVPFNSLDILNCIRPKQSLQYACNQINHNGTPLFPQNHRKFPEYLHSSLVHHQFTRFADWCRLGLYVLSELGGEFEYRVLNDVEGYIFMSFFLVTDVD